MPALPDGFEVVSQPDQQQQQPQQGASLPEGFSVVSQPDMGGADSSYAPPTATNAFALGASDLPVIGPTIQKGEAYLGALAQHLLDPSLDTNEIYQQNQAKMAQAQKDHPIAYMGGQAVGTTATLGTAAAAAAPVAAGLGMSPDMALGGRMLAGAGSNAAISGADASARGGTGQDVLKSTVIGGAAGGMFPLIGQGIAHLANALGEGGKALMSTVIGGKGMGTKLATDAISADRAAGYGLTPDQIAQAHDMGIPSNVGDLGGGPATKKALQSAASRSPERAAEHNTLQAQRTGEAQKQRLISNFSDIASVSNDAAQEVKNLHAEGQVLNKPAYEKAYTNTPVEMPKAIIGAPDVKKAMGQVLSRDWPNRYGSGDIATPKPRIFPAQDGSWKATTQFWDMVQRRLAIPEEGQDVSTMTGLRKGIQNALDAQNPAYKAARAQASNYLGAENAVEFGEKAAMPGADISHIRMGVDTLTPRQQAAFATGYVSKRLAQIRTQTPEAILNTIDRGRQNGVDILALGREKADQLHNMIAIERTIAATHFMAHAASTRTADLPGMMGGGGYGAMLGFGIGHEFGFSPLSSVLAAAGTGVMIGKMAQTGLNDIARGIIDTLQNGSAEDVNLVYKAANQSPTIKSALTDAFKASMKAATRAGMTAAPQNVTLPEQPGQAPQRQAPLVKAILGSPQQSMQP